MKQIRVSVYRAADMGDCTNNGVTSRHRSMILFYAGTKDEAMAYCQEKGIDPDRCLYLVERTLWGEQHNYAVPLVRPDNVCGPMFGGNFVYTCDSRLAQAMGTTTTEPVSVHDRFETQREYDALSI